MLNEFTTADILITFISSVTVFLALASLDRHLSRRHGSAANAAYLARMYARPTQFDFHRMHRSARIEPNEESLPALEPKMLTASPALLLLTSGRA